MAPGGKCISRHDGGGRARPIPSGAWRLGTLEHTQKIGKCCETRRKPSEARSHQTRGLSSRSTSMVRCAMSARYVQPLPIALMSRSSRIAPAAPRAATKANCLEPIPTQRSELDPENETIG